jgi:hypothetical protein
VSEVTLINPVDYQRVTGDTTTEVPDLDAALSDAISLVQDEIGRVLTYGSYVETLRVYSDGKVYPSATPLAAVIAPNLDQISIQGASIYLGYWNPSPLIEWFNAVPPQATVTYTGGYTAATLPVKLRNAIIRTAFNICHPSPLVGVPAGATSVHVADVGYSGGTLRALDPLDDGIKADLRGFRNPRFRGWQISVASA